MPAPAPRNLKVSAAYFRLLGYSQEDTGKQVRRSARTIFTWESEEQWPDIVSEAQERYLKEVIAVSRRAVINQIKDGDGDLGFKLLERNEFGFDPPAQRISHSGNVTQIIVKREHADVRSGYAESTPETNGIHDVTGEA